MKRDGTTLIEVLVAGALVTAALFPVLSLTSNNQRRTVVSQYQLVAQSWARRATAGLATVSYGQLRELQGQDVAAVPELSALLAAPAEFPGTLQVSVEDAGEGLLEDTSVPVMLKLTVTVTWSPYGPQETRGRGSVTLERLVSMPELSLVAPVRVNG
jgi:hypothetical protein